KEVFKGIQERGGTPGMTERKLAEELTRSLLRSSEAGQVQAGIDLAGAFKMSAFTDELMGVASNTKFPEAQRKSAAAAVGVVSPARAHDFLTRLLTSSAEAFGVREQAAQSLAGLNTPAAQGQLVTALATAPARLEKSIALALAGSRPGAEKLLDAVAAGKASARLLQDQPLVVRLRASKVPGLEEGLKRPPAGLPPADQGIQKLLAERRASFLAYKGVPMRGAAVFEKNCANCHQIGDKGARIAPQLDGI